MVLSQHRIAHRGSLPRTTSPLFPSLGARTASPAVRGVGSNAVVCRRSSLEVDGLAVGRHGGLLERLGHGRVSVASAADVLGGGAVLHREHALGDHLARVGGDDVDAEHHTVVSAAILDQELDETVGVRHGARARVGHEGERAHFVGDSLPLELLLRLAHRRNLRVRVDDARDRVVVDVPAQAGQLLRDGDALLLGLVRKHGAAHGVADRVDARHVGGEVVVDLDHAASPQLDANVLGAEPLRVRHAAGRGEDHVSLERLSRSAADRVHHQLALAALVGGRLDGVAHLELHALLLEDLLELLCDLVVDAGRDAVEVLDDGHLGAEPPPHGAHLEADDAGADDNELLRDLLKVEAACRVDDHLGVVVHRHRRPRHTGRHGARRDDDVLRGQRLRGAALHRVHGDRARRGDLSLPLEVVDLVLLEETLNAASQTRHRLRFVLHQLVKVHLDVVGGDAVRTPPFRCLLIQVRGVQQRLGRDAPHIEARAAQPSSHLYAGDFHAKLARLDGGRVAARAAADDDHVVGLTGGEASGQARAHGAGEGAAEHG
mmetsp:Transcript_4048/g.13098  ORF Transcript_4048/g.13098 Transcript_4048/m.13098 type:complete len:546 (+) Transcript_4048:298-1935(+)